VFEYLAAAGSDEIFDLKVDCGALIVGGKSEISAISQDSLA
jgi:hypothetical protein